MSRRWQDILYSPIYALFYLLALLPLPVLHIIARALYIIIYRIAGYRRKVARDNIEKAFPEKNTAEQREIERNFYRYFADYMVETIKLLHISDKEMRHRMEFVNAEVVDRYTMQGRSVMLLLGHYGNWEWIPSLLMWCKRSDTLVSGQIYSPLHNKWFDRFFLHLRSRFGSVGIPQKETLRRLMQYDRDGLVSLTGFMADQSPWGNNVHHWTTFMGRDTAVITGFEAIAKKMDMAVIYVDVELVKRGFYKATFRLLEDNPKACPNYDITDRYIAALEKTIRRAPHAWLWTHKRWKVTK